VLRADVVKAHGAAECGVEAKRRGLDHAEHSTTIKGVMIGRSRCLKM
jgi:hypothetical protein